MGAEHMRLAEAKFKTKRANAKKLRAFQAAHVGDTNLTPLELKRQFREAREAYYRNQGQTPPDAA